MSTPRCLVVLWARPQARRRLVLFPHAGGGASFYRSWGELLGPDIELQIVQYPGRETRMAEPLVSELGALVGEATAALCETDDGEVDTALFGHSMGAMVAHETAPALESQGGVRLTHLFVSGRRAPGGDGRDDPRVRHWSRQVRLPDLGLRQIGYLTSRGRARRSASTSWLSFHRARCHVSRNHSARIP